MLRLYSADICPYAQRVRAVLRRLGVPFEVTLIDLARRDPDFLALTPTGRVPLLVDGSLRLWESRVICEYLAERADWAAAWPVAVERRARLRLALDRWDAAVLPAWYDSLRDTAALDAGRLARVERELDELADVAAGVDDADDLAGHQLGPFWARFDWLRDYSPLPILIDRRPALRTWLDRTIELAAVRETLPGREWAIRRYEATYVAARTR